MTVAVDGRSNPASGGVPDVIDLINSADDAAPPAPVRLRRLLVLSDLVALSVGWVAAMVVLAAVSDAPMRLLTPAARGAVVVAGGILLLAAAGLYRRRICAIRAVEIARIIRVVLILAVTVLLLLLDKGTTAALWSAAAGGAAWLVVLLAERGLFREWIQARRASGDFGAAVLVVGGEYDSTRRTAAFLADNPYLGFDVRGLVCGMPEGVTPADNRYLGDPARLVNYTRQAGVSGVVLDAGSLTGEELNRHVRELSDATGVHVHISSGLRGVDRRRITVSPLADETFLHVAPIELTRLQLRVKRAVDVVVGSVLLLAFSPVLLVCMLMVWATDRGPVFYRQERVGHHGERFKLIKLRSMVVDAEARRARLEGQNGRSGPLFKLARDPRVTPIGRFLRASSLDEVPQLFNVLQGTMSLVGPRPALVEEVEQFDDELIERLTVKPGVTGLWQVEARDLPSFDLYRRYDLLYVQNWSLGLDLTIIARTATVVFVRTVQAGIPARLRRRDAVTILE